MPTADPSAYGSSWFAATAVSLPPRPRLTVEVDVDVCVIGAGLAGLTVAREVSRRGWSVLVLESQRVAWNASGRNSGFVMPGFAASLPSLIARVGVTHAQSLWSLSEAGAEYVRNAARGMPGVELTEGGRLHVSKTGSDAALSAQHELLAGQFGSDVEMWPAEQVRAALRSNHYFGALHYPRGFSVHPLNYALGLAAEAEAHGARICEETPALEIDPVGVRKRIVTPEARVRAGHVVLAGNVHLAGLLPSFQQTLMPVYGYVIATAPLGDALRDSVRFPGAISDTDHVDNHYRVADRERLIWSGRSTVWPGRPQRYVNTLLSDISRIYPQLGPVRAEYAWTGTVGSTVHGMPQIGELSPGLWLLSGFGSHGMNTTAMGGELVARAILDGERTVDQFRPFEMVWAGGNLGRVVQQTYYWTSRKREQVGGWLARQRDRRLGTAGLPDSVMPLPEYAAVTTAPAVEAAPMDTVAVPVQPPEIVEPATSMVPEAQPAPVGERPARVAKPRKKRQRKKATAAAAPDAPPQAPEIATSATPPRGEA
jgi:glycine/D-amino acid oxidase-like deaminating enzyme